MSQRSTFSQKCGLFDHYFKEKSICMDRSLEMSCSIEPKGTSDMLHQTTTTMNLFPITEKLSSLALPQDYRSMNSFPVQAVFASSVPKGVSKIADSSVNKPTSREPVRAQMTIFYAGQVYVFDELSVDKAKEVMVLASKEVSKTEPTYVTSPALNVSFPPHMAKNSIDSSNSVPSSSASVTDIGKKATNENIRPSSRPIICDLPIARKASLHRFLEKRKDRINAKAPYQSGNSGSAAPTKPDKSKSWLGLAAQQTQ